MFIQDFIFPSYFVHFVKENFFSILFHFKITAFFHSVKLIAIETFSIPKLYGSSIFQNFNYIKAYRSVSVHFIDVICAFKVP